MLGTALDMKHSSYCSVAKLCPALCHPIDCSTPEFKHSRSDPNIGPVLIRFQHSEEYNPIKCYRKFLINFYSFFQNSSAATISRKFSFIWRVSNSFLIAFSSAHDILSWNYWLHIHLSNKASASIKQGPSLYILVCNKGTTYFKMKGFFLNVVSMLIVCHVKKRKAARRSIRYSAW